MTEKPFLIITGMHRSGTSFLIRALNLSGVNLGSLESLNSTDWNNLSDNLRGHWENKTLLELADKTLSNNNEAKKTKENELYINTYLDINNKLNTDKKCFRKRPSSSSQSPTRHERLIANQKRSLRNLPVRPVSADFESKDTLFMQSQMGENQVQNYWNQYSLKCFKSKNKRKGRSTKSSIVMSNKPSFF